MYVYGKITVCVDFVLCTLVYQILDLIIWVFLYLLLVRSSLGYITGFIAAGNLK